MASRIQSLGNVLQTNTPVSPKSLVSGGNRQHLMEHCPGSPSPLLQVPGGNEKRVKKKRRGTEEKLKEEREGEKRQGGKGERDSTRWIMQSCQRRLLLEVLAVLKGASPDLHQPYSINHSHSPWLRDVWSVLRQMANNKMWRGEVGGRARALGDRWIVLEGHSSDDKYALYYRYLQRSPMGRSELICTAALRKYNYRTKP